MPELRKIDVHAHILSEETISLMRKEAPKIGPRLERIDDDFAVLEVAGNPYRPFPRGGWDMSRRLSDMDAAGIDMQVISNTPQTFLYNQESALAAALSALQNDQIAKAVAGNPNSSWASRRCRCKLRTGRRRAPPGHGNARTERRADRLQHQWAQSR